MLVQFRVSNINYENITILDETFNFVYIRLIYNICFIHLRTCTAIYINTYNIMKCTQSLIDTQNNIFSSRIHTHSSKPRFPQTHVFRKPG